MAADVAFLCHSDGVPACPGGCWPLVPFMGGVLSWSCHGLVAWCRPAIVVVVVVVSHCCSQSWLLMWHSCVIRMVYQHVQVVVGGGQWCGNDGWALWVGIVSGCRGWALWVGVMDGGGG